MLKIFIDTEFTDFIDTHLMSLGMVTESGKEFYAEVPYPDHLCSSFVREAVIPLLRKEPQYIFSVDELCERVLEWLSAVRRNSEDVGSVSIIKRTGVYLLMCSITQFQNGVGHA